MDQTTLRGIRQLIAKRKRWDLIFASIGLLSLAIAGLTFSALVIDMARAPRWMEGCP